MAFYTLLTRDALHHKNIGLQLCNRLLVDDGIDGIFFFSICFMSLSLPVAPMTTMCNGRAFVLCRQSQTFTARW